MCGGLFDSSKTTNQSFNQNTNQNYAGQSNTSQAYNPFGSSYTNLALQFGQPGVMGTAGAALPYYNNASALFGQASQQPDVNAFYNPMAANVMANMQDVFGQQMKQTTGNAIQQAGGAGAGRIGVAQANLAKQQGLAAGQTMSNLWSQAQQAAATQQQAQLGAAQGYGNLGTAAQNSAMAPYLALAQLTGQLAPQLGGQTTGATTQAGQQTGTTSGTGTSTTTSSPSLWSNLMNIGSFVGGFANRGGRINPYASGGGTPYYDDGGEVDAGDDPERAEQRTSGGPNLEALSQVAQMFGGGGGFSTGGSPFDPRTYMQQRKRGGRIGYDEGGEVPDELIPPPYDSRELPRALIPHIDSMLNEPAPPPPQIEGAAPGKVPSFESDPRMGGALQEGVNMVAPFIPGGQIAGAARPAATLAREALDAAPGIVNRTLGPRAGSSMSNPFSRIALGAAGASADALADPIDDMSAPNASEKTQIDRLTPLIDSKKQELRSFIAGQRNKTQEEALDLPKGRKLKLELSDLESALAKIEGPGTDLFERRAEARRLRGEAITRGNVAEEALKKKQAESQLPYAVKYPDRQEWMQHNMPKFSLATGAALGFLGGKGGKWVKPLAMSFGAGAGEGAATAAWPTLQDTEFLPEGQTWSKAASRLFNGDPDFYKRVGAGAATHGLLAAGASLFGGKTRDALGQGLEAAGKGMNLLRSMRAGPAATAEGVVAKTPMKMVKSEHFLADGKTKVFRYVNPNDPKDVRWHTGKSWMKKADVPKLQGEARGGRISSNPYFAAGGEADWEDNNPWTPELNDRFSAASDPFPGEDPSSKNYVMPSDWNATRKVTDATAFPESPEMGYQPMEETAGSPPAASPRMEASRQPTPYETAMPMGNGNPYAPPTMERPRDRSSISGALEGLGIISPGTADTISNFGRRLQRASLAGQGVQGAAAAQKLPLEERSLEMQALNMQRQMQALNSQMQYRQQQIRLRQEHEDLNRAKPVIGPPDENGYRQIWQYNPQKKSYELNTPGAGADATTAPQPTGQTPAAPPQRGPVQVADLDQGIYGANAQVMSEGPYNYSKDAPYIEKGMDVPEPDGIGNKSSRALQTDAEYYLQTGKLPPISRGQSPVAIQQARYRDAVQNYANAVAQSRGLSPAQMADMWRSAPGMLRFILGADGRTTVALGTAVRHLDTMKQLAEAWKIAGNTGDMTALNSIKATVARQFGNAAVTNLDAGARILGPEIIKALGVAGAGAHGERLEAGGAFSPGRSPDQIIGAIETTQRFLGGQLEQKKTQAAMAGVPEQKFRELVGERPYEVLTNAEKNATATPAGGAAQEGAIKQFKQGWGIFRNGKWQPYQDQGPRQ